MEFKGTKGSWEINPRASRNVRCGNITIANCSSGQNGDNEEEEKFNAKLIAKAPEMFEMLKILVSHYNSGDSVGLSLRSDVDKTKELLIKITE
jgi:hypothetical protein